MYLTPAIVEEMYNLLRACPPFRSWRLPPSDEVAFHITLSKKTFGKCVYDWDDKHTRPPRFEFHASARCIRQLGTLTRFMAHEMIHMREYLTGVRDDVKHGASFQRMADQVCRLHGFDRGEF
jgi:hypothetical protein